MEKLVENMAKNLVMELSSIVISFCKILFNQRSMSLIVHGIRIKLNVKKPFKLCKQFSTILMNIMCMPVVFHLKLMQSSLMRQVTTCIATKTS